MGRSRVMRRSKSTRNPTRRRRSCPRSKCSPMLSPPSRPAHCGQPRSPIQLRPWHLQSQSPRSGCRPCGPLPRIARTAGTSEAPSPPPPKPVSPSSGAAARSAYLNQGRRAPRGLRAAAGSFGGTQCRRTGGRGRWRPAGRRPRRRSPARAGRLRLVVGCRGPRPPDVAVPEPVGTLAPPLCWKDLWVDRRTPRPAVREARFAGDKPHGSRVCSPGLSTLAGHRVGWGTPPAYPRMVCSRRPHETDLLHPESRVGSIQGLLPLTVRVETVAAVLPWLAADVAACFGVQGLLGCAGLTCGLPSSHAEP
mmetsp:Transcript_41507/g.109265  ORF Transcript_41507/g.109265 Transcript_41507/m.109265 type:complete len:307 (+) Transcript_41507:574-1494(+)